MDKNQQLTQTHLGRAWFENLVVPLEEDEEAERERAPVAILPSREFLLRPMDEDEATTTKPPVLPFPDEERVNVLEEPSPESDRAGGCRRNDLEETMTGCLTC